jgi:hypothetical protein
MAKRVLTVFDVDDPGVDFFGLPRNPGTFCPPEEKMTRESDAASADINFILKRAGVSSPGQLPLPPAVYFDVTELGDYRVLSDRLVRVREYFDGMRAEIRAEFMNDPLVFLDAVNDPRNADRLREIGVFEAVPVVSAPGEGGAVAPASAVAPL